jgi:hypothetical protein
VIQDNDEKGRKVTKKKWGPVMIEPRPSRQHRNGRTILEKAQDRKKRANLDSCHGNSKTYNPFSIPSNFEISSVTSVVKISLGENKMEKMSSLARIQELDLKRVKECRENCDICSVSVDDVRGQSLDDVSHEGDGNVNPNTPTSQLIKPQCESEVEALGQWTPMVNRKKLKIRVIHEGSLLEYQRLKPVW